MAPSFPLPPRVVYEDRRTFQVRDDEATQITADREAEVWAWVWRTPQACAWSMPSERWRLYTVAMWVRTFVLCESAEATAADKASLHRFADQIGMTTAGLAEMGWKVAVDEVAAKVAGPKRAASSRSKLKVVRAGDGA